MQFNFGGVSITPIVGAVLGDFSNNFDSTNQTIREMVDIRGNAKLHNSTLLAGLSARGSIEVDGGEIRGKTCSAQDAVKGRNAAFGSIEGRKYVALDSCTAGPVDCKQGGISLNGASKILGAVTARLDVDIRRGGVVQGKVYSSQGEVEAYGSKLEKVKARQHIDLSACTTAKVHGEQGDVFMRDSVATGPVISRGPIELINSSVQNVTSEQGSVCIRGRMHDYGAISVEAKNDVTLENTRVGQVVSHQGEVIASGSVVDGSITAGAEAELTDTDAFSVTVTAGCLTVRRSETGESQNYDYLFARDDIWAINVNIGSVECGSRTGSKFAACTMGKLTLNVEPGSPVKLVLTEPTLMGDLIVKVKPNRRAATFNRGGSVNAVINTRGFSGVTVSGGEGNRFLKVDTRTVFMDRVYHCHSIQDLSREDIKLMLHYGEGAKGIIGGLEVIVHHGRVVPRASVPTTLAEIESVINSIIGNGDVSRAEIDGGVYSRQNGKLRVIHAPLGFAAPEVASSSEPDRAKMIQLQISGGEIRGKIRFEGCYGEYTLVDGATLLEANG